MNPPGLAVQSRSLGEGWECGDAAREVAAFGLEPTHLQRSEALNPTSANAVTPRRYRVETGFTGTTQKRAEPLRNQFINRGFRPWARIRTD